MQEIFAYYYSIYDAHQSDPWAMTYRGNINLRARCKTSNAMIQILKKFWRANAASGSGAQESLESARAPAGASCLSFVE